MSLEKGSIVEGKVTGVMPFGAFVSLPDNKSGLVHISEITKEYVKDIKDYIKQGDEVKVKVLDIDKNGKINLSIRQAQVTEKKQSKPKATGPVRPADADEKMLALKRSNESKRSGGYHRGGGTY